MRRLLSRRIVYALSIGLFILFVGWTLPSLSEIRNSLVREYFKHKEFLFNLKQARYYKKHTPSEQDIETMLSGMGFKVEKILSSESGVEVTLEDVHWSKVHNLIKSLERRFEISSFSAVDNTGKGVFKVRIVVR